CVVLVHWNDQLVLHGVVAHGGGRGDPGGDHFRVLAWADARHAAVAHAAYVLGAVFQDHQTIVAAFDGVFGPYDFSVRAVGDDSVVTDVHHHDVAVSVNGDAVGRCQWSPFCKHGNLAVSGNLVDALGTAGVGGIDCAVSGDAYAIQA